MAILKAKNYSLIGAYTQIKTAVSASATSVDVDSTVGFNANDWVVIGNPGEENCEIKRITAITDGDTLAVQAVNFAHLVYEPIYFIPYDQIEFNKRTTSGGSETVLTTKTMNYEETHTSYDYPTASTSEYYIYRYKNSYTSNYSSYSDEEVIPTYYCNPNDVADYLNDDINSESSKINYDQVEKMIDRITSEIDNLTNSSFKSNTATNEYHDGKGTRGDEYFLKKGPVISITSLSTTQNDEDTDSASITWDSLTEDDDFFVDYDTGKISITDSSYNPDGRNRFKVTYTWGRSSVPKTIKRLATLMTIRELGKLNAIKSVIKGQSEFSNFSYKALDDEINSIISDYRRESQYST